MRKFLTLTALVFLTAILLVVPSTALTNIYQCGSLTTSNEVYQMNQSIVPNGAAGTSCVSITTAQNITVRGYGYSIWNQTYAGIGVSVAGSAKNVTIEGFNVSVFNAIPAEIGSSYCYRTSSNNVTFKNNYCENSRAGVWMNTFPNSTRIINNTFKYITSFSSIYIQTGVDDLIIANNTFLNGTYNAPISFVTAGMRATNILIDNNVFAGSNRSINLATTSLWGGNITITNNQIVNKSDRFGSNYFIDIRGAFDNVIFSGNNITGIKTNGSLYSGDFHMDNASNFIISNNSFNGNEAIYGIELSNLNRDGRISENTVRCNSSDSAYGLHGIILRQGNNITVINNNVTSCAFGLLSHNGSRNYVFRDNIAMDNGVGLYIIDDSLNGTFVNNTFADSGGTSIGIHLFTYSDRNNPSPSFNLIENNTVVNYSVGIKLSNGTNNNVFRNNNLSAITTYNIQTAGASYNIYNLFINNTFTQQVGSLFTLVKGLYLDSSQYGLTVNYSEVSGTLSTNMSIATFKAVSSSASKNNITFLALTNAIIFNQTRIIAGSQNINSNDGTISLLNFGGSGNNATVLNNYNVTEGVTRERDPVSFAINTQTSKKLTSTLLDYVNVTLKISTDCSAIYQINYTNNDSYSIGGRDEQVAPICNNFTSGRLTQISAGVQTSIFSFSTITDNIYACAKINGSIFLVLGFIVIIILIAGGVLIISMFMGGGTEAAGGLMKLAGVVLIGGIIAGVGTLIVSATLGCGG